MEGAFYIVVGLALYALVCVWIRSRLRYQVTPHSFKISLFGLRLRRIPLDAIERVSTRRSRRGVENWSNSFRLAHRILVVRLKPPARRDILITPPQRYVFKTELEEALPRDAARNEEEPTQDPDAMEGK